MARLPTLLSLATVLAVLTPPRPAGLTSVVVGQVRVQALSQTLVRVEVRGPAGFEDRPTFNVVERSWPGVEVVTVPGDGEVWVVGPGWSVVVPEGATSLLGTRVHGADGAVVQVFGPRPPRVSFLPSPGRVPQAWVMPDAPRVVPGPWGAAPPPAGQPFPPHAGWDLQNVAPDAYVFLPGEGGYPRLREDFLRLTGPIPLPPLYTLGHWTSRYHAYTDSEALADIDTFRRKGIPLDLFVVDTDWRMGASHGYQVDQENFPDMAAFIEEAHARQVRLLFNDHPEPQAGALDQVELRYRWDGLTGLMALGVDAWWYDRNWITHLAEPVEGLRKEVWGMRLYHDITARFRPDRRPLIMSNVQGITSGILHGPSDPAAHRYPVWWTGDTYADWFFLDKAVRNAVDAGVLSLLPYLHDDCGGHFLKSTPELFARFFQFCALGPVLRPHSTKDRSRLPWHFDDQVERQVTDYARLRYRLLPLLYAAARRAHDDGTPLLRRCDLEWPHLPDAANPTQYLLGDDLLVAPVLEPSVVFQPLPADHLEVDGQPGARVELFSGPLGGHLLHASVTADVSAHGWPARRGAVFPEGISARWTTRWRDLPETGTYLFRLDGWGMGRLYLDGSLLVDDVATMNDMPVPVSLSRGQSVEITVEHLPATRWLHTGVHVATPSRVRTTATRPVWLPPGEWVEAWSGQRVVGPATVEATVGPAQVPLYVRAGGVVLGLPQQQHTAQGPWSTVVVDAYVSTGDVTQTRTLYEDDNDSNAYLDGAHRRTDVTLARQGSRVALRVLPARGGYPGALTHRSWLVRLHVPPGRSPSLALVDGVTCGGDSSCRVVDPSPRPVEMPFLGEGSPDGPAAGPVVEVLLAPRAADAGLVVEVDL
jgi:hypothetical protein